MTASQAIKRLRAEGYDVSVTHLRRLRPIAADGTPLKPLPPMPPRDYTAMLAMTRTLPFLRFDDLGGLTSVIVTAPNGLRSAAGIARCAPGDAFDERVGVEIALYRALSFARPRVRLDPEWVNRAA